MMFSVKVWMALGP